MENSDLPSDWTRESVKGRENAQDLPQKPIRLSSEAPRATGKVLFNGRRLRACRAARLDSLSTLTPMRATIAEAYSTRDFDGCSVGLAFWSLFGELPKIYRNSRFLVWRGAVDSQAGGVLFPRVIYSYRKSAPPIESNITTAKILVVCVALTSCQQKNAD